MDPEWKKQNQMPNDSPDADSGQAADPQPAQDQPGQGAKPLSPDVIKPNQDVRPAQTPRQTTGHPGQSPRPADPPGQRPTPPVNPSPVQSGPSASPNVNPQPANYQNPLPGQGSYGQNAAPGSRRKIIIISAAVVLVILIAAGAYFLLKGDSSQNQSNTSGQSESEGDMAIPADWETVDTKLGFTVKAPPGWSGSFPGDFNLGGLETKNLTIGNADEIANSDEEFGNYVTVGTQSRSEIGSRKDLADYLKDPDKNTALYEAFGVDKSQVDITVSETTINGRKWLQSDAAIPGQIGRTMYFWVNDHAITLAVTSDSQVKLDELTENYLVSMTASVDLQ